MEPDEEVGIGDIKSNRAEGGVADVWHTLDGRTLSGKPATKGIFIRNGKKMLVR